MSDLKAIGIHVFAGGFTRGVLDAGWDVKLQLEAHGFGLGTTERMNGVSCVNVESADWPTGPETDALMAFGNPRCTAFSTITSGDRYVQSSAHGAWAKQTCDIHQMCEYSAGKYDFLIWESVQQAYTGTGRELVDYLVRQIFAPRGYRVAHLLLNAASFGNCQQRKRYFFVAYRDCYRFNVEPPPITPWYSTLYDAIRSQNDREVRPAETWQDDCEYDRDCYKQLKEADLHVVPNLPNGWSLHTVARHGFHLLHPKHQRTWTTRTSNLPFSLHGIVRLNWLRPCPTLHSSSCNFIHPEHHRPMTVGELAMVMGWPEGVVPVGKSPSAQIAKGIAPSAGAWLAKQVELSYRGHWGKDDWESSYDPRTGEWRGSDSAGRLEKECDMTGYVGKYLDPSRYDLAVVQQHRFNLCERTGRPILAWHAVAQQYTKNGELRDVGEAIA